MLVQTSNFIRIRESSIKNPEYTIVIPTYKRAQTLRNTLESCFSQRTVSTFNILVVDNNPERDDETERFMSGITDGRLSYFKNSENVGMFNNWNQCLLGADGGWAVMVHDDDLLESECISVIEETRKNYPKADAILPRYEQINNPYFPKRNDNKKKATIKKYTRGGAKKLMKKLVPAGLPVCANLFLNNIYGAPTCGLALDRTKIIEFGGWQSPCSVSADWETMYRYASGHIIIKAPKMTGTYLWAVNASLRPETVRQFSADRDYIIKEIVSADRKARFLYGLLRKDFTARERRAFTEVVPTSFLFRLFAAYYSLRVR